MSYISGKEQTSWSFIIMVAIAASIMLLGAGGARGAGCVGAPEGSFSWWTGNSTALDSGGPNNGILMNGATYAEGKVGKAFSFAGAGYVQAPDTNLPTGNGPRTLAFWMKTDVQQDGKAPVIYGTWSAPSAFYVSLFGDKACIGNWGGGDQCGTRPVIDGAWHFVALTYDSGTAKLYVDGVVDRTVSRTYNTSLSGNIHIGGTPSIHYTGLVDEVIILPGSPTPDEVAAVYSSGSAGFCPVTDPFPLRQGWNFVSFPKTPPAGVAAALGNQASNVPVVWGYDNNNQRWLRWKPTGGMSNTLQTFEIGKGYWIYAASNGSIDVSQWMWLSTFLPVIFEPGWNLIGYNGTNGLPVADGLQAISGQWSIIWTWAYGTWGAQTTGVIALPSAIEPLTYLYQGAAYWVKVKDSYVAPPPGTWDQSLWDLSVWGE